MAHLERHFTTSAGQRIAYSNPTGFVKIGEGFFSGAAPPSPAVRLALLQLT